MEADGMLRMHTMRFADALVDPRKLDVEAPRNKPDERMLKMAKQLVDGLTTTFKPGKYRDTYRDRVLDLVKRKAKGEEIDIEKATPPEQSDDLMAALEASLKKGKR